MEIKLTLLLGFDIVDEKDQVANMKEFALERWKKKQKTAQDNKLDSE